MKEISIKDFGQEYNFMNFHDDWAALVADDGSRINSLTVSWGSIGYLWNLPTFSAYIHDDRFSQHIFDNSDYYSVCIFDRRKYQKALSYLGTVSGRDEDKIKGCGLTLNKEEKAPYFLEARYVLICKKTGDTDFVYERVKDDVEFKKYYKQTGGVHRIFEGEIIKVLKNENE